MFFFQKYVYSILTAQMNFKCCSNMLHWRILDLIAQEREAEHQKQLLELEKKLVKQSEYKQAELGTG